MNSKSFFHKVVVVLDPRGVIIAGGHDVINRHQRYADSLNEFTGELRLIIISSGQNLDVTKLKYPNLEIFSIANPSYNFYRFASESKKLIKGMNWDIKLLIAGDCWESFWSAYFLNRFMSKNAPIQIQIHGDIADLSWRRINLKNRIRYSLAKLSLAKASSVRAVTKYQAENLVKAFGVKTERIVVIPVPINVIGKLVASKSERPKTIGLLGRIHQDRGIWEFIKLVRILNLNSKDFNVVVIGDGPSTEKFLLKLSSVIPKNRINYLGQLSEGELRKVWKKIGVLVSMAPVESYGRAMRESLIAGVPVWATASTGVKDLMDNCKKGEVKLLDLSKSSASLEKDFNLLLKTKVGSDFSKRFIKENNAYAAKLADSWINIIKKSK